LGESQSLLNRFTRVAGQIGSILSRIDLDVLDRTQIRLVGTIKRLTADTRLDIRDWEMAETREEMLGHSHEALKRLEQTREAILLASQYDIFSAIEVGEISAHFDLFANELRQ
jgi:hypothetical protein